MNENLKANLQKIQLLLLDCDGVLTDGFSYFGPDGAEMARFSHRDGQGIKNVRQLAHVEVAVISTQTAPYVQMRCKKIGIPCHVSVDKVQKLRELINKHYRHIPLEAICLVEDDVGGLEALKIVGFPVAVADAAPEVIALAKYVTRRMGGNHAVRELCDLILEAKGIKL